CQVTGPSGADGDTQVVTLPRIPLVSQDRVVAVTYPDLSTRFVKDAAGRPVLDSSGQPQVETCPSGAVDRPGDLLDGLPDGLINGKAIDTTSSPRMSQTEWAWGGTVMLGLTDPAPNNAVPSTYLYTPEAGGTPVPLSFVDTLNASILEW